jgi:hypothetical protein
MQVALPFLEEGQSPELQIFLLMEPILLDMEVVAAEEVAYLVLVIQELIKLVVTAVRELLLLPSIIDNYKIENVETFI